MDAKKKKNFRSIGHSLKPIVMIGSKGITQSVVEETIRALTDHELIKIKFAVGDRELKKKIISQLVKQTSASLIHTIGNIILIYKKNHKEKPKLSNIS